MLKLEEVQSLYKETDIDPGDAPESVLNTFIMALGGSTVAYRYEVHTASIMAGVMAKVAPFWETKS